MAIKQQQTGLQEFIASMNRSKGFARLSRYAVVITPPGNLENLMNIAGQVQDQSSKLDRMMNITIYFDFNP